MSMLDSSAIAGGQPPISDASARPILAESIAGLHDEMGRERATRIAYIYGSKNYTADCRGTHVVLGKDDDAIARRLICTRATAILRFVAVEQSARWRQLMWQEWGFRHLTVTEAHSAQAKCSVSALRTCLVR